MNCINRINTLKIGAIALFLGILTACGGGTDVVESGTYHGTIKEVEPEKTEIYVTTNDGQVLELYFTDETELTRAGEPVAFETLEEGQTVEVVVEKTGKRLDPISVEIRE